MSIPIAPVRMVNLPEIGQLGSSTSSSGAPAATGGFQSVLEGMIGRVEQAHTQGQQAIEGFLSGGNDELHSVALSAQRSELQFELFLQVRNKAVQAYQEIMRMQV